MFQNITLDTSATVTDAEGKTVNANTFLCENKAIAIVLLEAIKASVKNGFAQWVVGAVVTLLESILNKVCEPK